MKIVITDDEGRVLDKYSVDADVARDLLDIFNDPFFDGASAAVEKVLDDLAAACRAEIRDEGWGT